MRLLVRILVCLAICAWLLMNTLDWQKAAESYEARFTPTIDLPGAKKPYFFDNDCYYWLSYAERMAATGEWRIRYTHIDNVPYGREMHWSQSIAWLEMGFGKIRALATGESWLEAIPRAAIWVNPALLALGGCLLFVLLDGCVGFLPAALGVLWMLALSDLAWAFQPYRPDHQSLHLLFSLATFAFFLTGGAGWVSDRPRDKAFRWLAALQAPSEKVARCYFIASGIAGGLALWVGATLQVCCLGLIGLATLSAALFVRKHDDGGGQRFVPELFRLWSRVGAGTSLLLYAVEYAPGHLSMRLEVNHPLYALSWLASGELLAMIFCIRFARRASTPREWGLGILWAGVAAILPIVLFFGGANVHLMRDLEVLRLQKYINESLPYFKTSDVFTFLGNYGALPFCVPLAWGLVFWGRLTAMERWTLWVAAMVCFGTFLLTLVEQRWACHYALFSVVVMALTVAALMRPPGRGPWVVGFTALAILGVNGIVLFIHQQKKLGPILTGQVLDKKVAQRILMKRFAVQMAQLVKAGDVRLLAEPTLAPALYYFGGLRSIVTFYWENRDGLHAAADFFDATDDREARRIATERGLTHVLLPKNGNAAMVFHDLRTGELLSPGDVNLAVRLMKNRGVPAWMTRDTAMTDLASCVFRGAYRIAYPVDVWTIAPAGPGPNP